MEYLHRSLYTARKAADYFGWVSIPWAENGIEREIDEKNDEIYRLVRACIDLWQKWGFREAPENASAAAAAIIVIATATAVVAADVRNGCLCRGRQWFSAMLAPFQQVYSALPEFKNTQFNYTYKDGLQREITVSINNDVQNVLKQLSQCP